MSPPARRSLLATVVLAALTSACADGLGPNETVGPSATAHSPKAASPAVGAMVFDTDLVPLVWGGDPRDGLAVAVGYEQTVAQICADPNGDHPLSPGSGIGVVTPAGGIPITAMTREAYVIVYQYGGGVVTNPCAQLIAAPILATGRVTYTVSTSDALDILSPGAGGPGAAIVHAVAEGVVQLTAGGDARLAATLRLVFGADGSLVFDEERVRLTPM